MWHWSLHQLWYQKFSLTLASPSLHTQRLYATCIECTNRLLVCIHTYTDKWLQKLTNTVLHQMDKYLSAAVWYFLPAHGLVTSFQIASKKFINSRHLKPSNFWIVINESLLDFEDISSPNASSTSCINYPQGSTGYWGKCLTAPALSST